MPPRILTRSPVGVVIVAWKVWQRLARSHGVKAAQAHGPRIASLLAKRAARRR